MDRWTIIPRDTMVRYTGHSILGGVQHGEVYRVACPNDSAEDTMIGLDLNPGVHWIPERNVEVVK